MKTLSEKIFNIKNNDEFNHICLNVFKIQANENLLYKKYINELKINIDKIRHYTNIPFLPIDFFKTHKVISGKQNVDLIFNSSGTTGSNVSTHYVTDRAIYERSFLDCFNLFYGTPKQYTFLALLPSYLEREASSLVYMVQTLIKESNNTDSGFYLYNHDKLQQKLTFLEKNGKKTILIGVSFALTDFFQNYNFDLKHTIVIETGGMKGRKKEITKEELHELIKKGSGLSNIHSEYGMTELLSQAYSKGDNRYFSPP